MYPCYAYLIAKRFGKVKNYNQWIKPRICSNTLELLEKELPHLETKIKSVFLCFTTDPFMYGYDDINELSLEVIKKINSHNKKVIVLTKGLLPKKLEDTSKINEYGITLITTDENYRKILEPGGSPIEQRVEALRYLHDKGFFTWVSIEPYPTPNIIDQDISVLLEKIKFVDKIIFGRLNYNPKSTSYKNRKDYYNKLTRVVIDFCKTNGIEYFIKKKTQTET
jgi:DNA repair photolyase